MKKSKIIFDMDGVITTEQRYWDCAALTVWEMYFSEKYFGTKKLDMTEARLRVKEIRDYVFCGDRIIHIMKNYGVNSNWDLAYAVLAGIIHIGGADFEKVCRLFEEKKLRAPEIYDFANEILCEKLAMADCSRSSELWQKIMYVFQEWYYGDEAFEEQYGFSATAKGKKGFMHGEIPMFSIQETENLLKTLRDKGIILGIGTGRCAYEIETPLKLWGLDKYFDKKSCCTFDMMAEAEKKQGIFLSKPHPYTFLKAAFGNEYTDEQLIRGEYDDTCVKEILIVGDAGTDLFAAKAMKADFAAVLTGVSGKKAEAFFKENNSELILENVLKLAERIEND